MPGLIETFNIAKRGMNVQQTALQVISHNVSNANTEGYSVQRADIKTTDPFGMPSLNSAGTVGQLGTGSEVSSITRSRDEFLDNSIRKEASTLNRYQTREEFLSSVESIFTEPSDTGIASTMNKFWNSWNGLSTNPESSTARTLVKSSSVALADAISHSYSQLEDVEVNVSDLAQQQTFDVSTMIKQIADLNGQIKTVTIAGQTPNDLMDRRDLLLDKLSGRMGIEVDKTNFNGISVKVKMADGTKKDILQDGTVVSGLLSVTDVSISTPPSTTQKKDFPKTFDTLPKEFEVNTYVDGNINNPKTVKVTISDKEADGITNKPDAEKLAELRKYFNISVSKVKDASGNEKTQYRIDSIKCQTMTYDPQAPDRQPIPADFDNGSIKGLDSLAYEVGDYKNQLNNLAKVIAISVNTVHSNSSDPNDPNALNFFDPNAETSDHAAKDLKVNKVILDDVTKINAGKYLNGDPLNASGNGERAMLTASLRNSRMDILNITSRKDFINDVFTNADGTTIDSTKVTSQANGINLTQAKTVNSTSGTSIDGYFQSTISNLGVSNQEAKRMSTNQESLLNQITSRRESISGVSIDEEITNMMQFQRSYQANAKMISVIDELLDVVVNGLMKR